MEQEHHEGEMNLEESPKHLHVFNADFGIIMLSAVVVNMYAIIYSAVFLA